MTADARRSVRRAGVAILTDGGRVAWSVADGRRGRRWRAITRRDGAVGISLLLEVGPDGRAARLELATMAGLLTVHPEASGFLHGNVVTDAGVRHLTEPWSDDHELEIDPRDISGAVTAHRLAGSIAVGEGSVVQAVIIDADLAIREASRSYVRLDATTWRVEGDGAAWTLTVDADGLPVWPTQPGTPSGAGEWPLELDPQV